jgi:hypothetical protein
MLRPLAPLLALVALTVHSTRAVADAADPSRPFPEHRLGVAGSVEPAAISGSSDGHMRDAKNAMGLGMKGSYAARVARNFQIGVGVGYTAFNDNGGDTSLYAHEIQVPLEVGIVIPASDRVEFLVEGRAGFVHQWFPNQGWVEGVGREGHGTLRSMGFGMGAGFAAFFAVAKDVDLFANLELDVRLTQVTNGVDYTKNSGVIAGGLPLSLGLRSRF